MIARHVETFPDFLLKADIKVTNVFLLFKHQENIQHTLLRNYTLKTEGKNYNKESVDKKKKL
jgi:hypothetical protein